MTSPPSPRWRTGDVAPDETEPLLNGNVHEQRVDRAISQPSSPNAHDTVEGLSSSEAFLEVQESHGPSASLRIAAAMYSFFVMGLIQSTVGVSSVFCLHPP